MAKDASVTESPKKRGPPPGPRKNAATHEKVKGKRGRPPASGTYLPSQAISPMIRKGGKGYRYTPEEKKKIVTSILSKGRGGFKQAGARFDVSLPSLTRWVRQARSGKASFKIEKYLLEEDRHKKKETASAGQVLARKKVIKELRKGIASLEAALGAFSNALRALE